MKNLTLKQWVVIGAALCSYLVMSSPFCDALQINLLYGGATLDTVNINPHVAVTKDVSISNDRGWRTIKVNLEIKSALQPIKKAYVFFCANDNPDDCFRRSPMVFESYVNVSRDWTDISSSGRGYPQVSNILTLVRIDIGGRMNWVAYWDRIERTSLREFNTNSIDISSLDYTLRNAADVNLTSNFIKKYMMVPTLWMKDAVFGDITTAPVAILYSGGGNYSELPVLQPRKMPGAKSIDAAYIYKEFEMFYPGTAGGLIANGITFNTNPSYTCGDRVCDTDSGETETNCCLDCADQSTRECSGAFEGTRCYVDDQHPNGYCGSKCGEGGCETGESADSCCLDCGCGTGQVCNTNKWDAAGSCINETDITLYLDEMQQNFKSCERPHKAEMTVHIRNAPSDMRVEKWYYKINNATGSDIRCKGAETEINSSLPYYDCNLNIRPLPNCRRGTYHLENNALYALVTYSGGSKMKLLTAKMPDITIEQVPESISQITDYVITEFNSINEDLKEGIDDAKEFLDMCIEILKAAIWVAIIMAVVKGLAAAFSTEPAKTSGFLSWFTTPTVSGAQMTMNGLSAGMSGFLEGFGGMTKIAQSICDVAVMLMEVYQKIAAAMGHYVAYNVCIKVYQNALGNGDCGESQQGSETPNQDAALSGAKRCLNMLSGCITELDAMGNSLKTMSKENQVLTTPKTDPFDINPKIELYEEGYVSSVADTCGNLRIRLSSSHKACGTSSVSITFDPAAQAEKPRTISKDMNWLVDVSTFNAAPGEIFTMGEGTYAIQLTCDGEKSPVQTYKYSARCTDSKSIELRIAGRPCSDGTVCQSKICATRYNDNSLTVKDIPNFGRCISSGTCWWGYIEDGVILFANDLGKIADADIGKAVPIATQSDTGKICRSQNNPPSTGLPIEKRKGNCRIDAECAPRLACSSGGTCEDEFGPGNMPEPNSVNRGN